MTERTTRDMTTDRKQATGEKQKERPTREDKGGGTRPREATREPRHEQSPDDAAKDRDPTGESFEPERAGEHKDPEDREGEEDED